MPDQKISDLSSLESGVSNDLLYIVDVGAGTSGSKNITVTNLFRLVESGVSIIMIDSGVTRFLANTTGVTVAGIIESSSGGFKLPDGSVIDAVGDLGKWTSSGSDILYPNGKVGVGVTPAVYGLEVSPSLAVMDGTGVSLFISNVSGTTVRNSLVAQSGLTVTNSIQINTNGEGVKNTTGDLSFSTNGVANHLYLTRVASGGRIGVRMTDPGYYLDVTQSLAVRGASGSTNFIVLSGGTVGINRSSAYVTAALTVDVPPSGTTEFLWVGDGLEHIRFQGAYGARIKSNNNATLYFDAGNWTDGVIQARQNFGLEVKTTNAYPVSIWSNNVERMTFQSGGTVGIITSSGASIIATNPNGYVGINQPSSSAPLHIAGNIILGGGVTSCGGTSVIAICSGVTPTSLPAHGAIGAGGVTGGILWVNDSGALVYRGPKGTDTIIAHA